MLKPCHYFGSEDGQSWTQPSSLCALITLMTIAACYVCPEGVVLGADSTATFAGSGRYSQHYDFTQKLFEVGEAGKLGIVTWGVGGLGPVSYRTLVARLADKLNAVRPGSVMDAAWLWSSLIWPEYCTAFASKRLRYQELIGMASRTTDEEGEKDALLNDLRVGFCIGGACGVNRIPQAFEMELNVATAAPVTPLPISMGIPKFWGWSNLINRLSYGMDESVFGDILDSGKWSGTPDELFAIVEKRKLFPQGILPIRDAIDWVYSSIYTTIKGIKFSRFDQACGGPIEIAVVTTDRDFRWVRHKSLDAAIS